MQNMRIGSHFDRGSCNAQADLQRRSFLRLMGQGVLGTLALAACGGGGNGGGSNAGLPTIAPQPLAIPPLLDPPADANGVRRFALDLKPAQVRFYGAGYAATNTYGINGQSYLGPTLRFRRGDQVVIAVRNGIGQPTTMHWHGVHAPSDMDGGPHQLISPGATWTARYTVNQPACTAWYHPHPHGTTAEQVYHGLAGMIWIDDPSTQPLGLPTAYGVDDIPLVIQDRLFDASGAFQYLPLSRQERMRGKLGNAVLVNGTVNAYWNAPQQVVRLRLLNGSNARVYRLGVPGVAMHLIASDGSFLASPVPVSEIQLSPGERAEVLLDLSALALGTQLELLDYASGWRLLAIRVANPAANPTAIPANLVNPNLPAVANPAALPQRSFVYGKQPGPDGKFTINGVPMDPTLGRIDQQVPVNTLELWTVSNPMNMTHNFHVHGASFAVVDRNGSAANLLPHEQAWKDTVYLGPNETVRLLVKFTQRTVVAGNGSPLPYMFHCHILEHEDWGMMGQLVVV